MTNCLLCQKETKQPHRKYCSKSCAAKAGSMNAQEKRLANIPPSERYKYLSSGALRKQIIIEQNNICNHCGISSWLNKPLILELEHKDGNTQNNERSNLEALCPNCHSLTPTWRGRNKSKRLVKVSDEELLQALQTYGSFRTALISLGLVGGGANYKRCYELLAKQA